MKLYYADASPFARKVRILAAEIGLADKIQLITINPWADETLRAVNPLSKVPTLVADDGQAIYDSRVICIYLDRLAGTGRVTAASLDSLRMEALADGIADAGVRRLRETLRKDGAIHHDVVARQNAAIAAGLDEAERVVTAERFDIGEMALAASLGYLDFRHLQEGWREPRPRLAAWFQQVGARDSVASTAPV
jgi:glutathione S-transferase